MKTLFLIPARGGSKGIPRKNIKEFAGKPLILYAVEQAMALADTQDICVSTDDMEIKSVVENHGLPVPFLRPAELASDKAGSYNQQQVCTPDAPRNTQTRNTSPDIQL